MADTAHRLTDKKLEEMEKRLSAIHSTHNAIHYGDSNLLASEPIERKKNDTCPWKR